MKSFRCGDVVPGCAVERQGTEDGIPAEVATQAGPDCGVSELEREDDSSSRVRRTPRPT